MISTFQKSRAGRTPTFTCRVCKKLTRETGHDESSVKLCAFCSREAELENSLSDGAITEDEFHAALTELERQYKRRAFAKQTKTTKFTPEVTELAKKEVAELKTLKMLLAKKAASQTPSAKNARRIIRNFLRIAMELAMIEDDADATFDEIEGARDAFAAADATLSTIPGYNER